MTLSDECPSQWQRLMSVARTSAAAALTSGDKNSILVTKPHRNILVEGREQGRALVILDGWASQYKLSRDGKHQIVGLLLPGDICLSSVFRPLDHSIEALTEVRYAEVSLPDIERAVAASPSLALELIQMQVAEAAIQREWINNIGQRPALARIAHLFCEIFSRLRTKGLVEKTSFPFPLTQQDLAFALGLTSVHVNRMLQEMRRLGLIELHHRRLELPDLAGLRHAAMFDPTYLGQEPSAAIFS